VSRKGIETLELALILPAILLLGLGSVEFSRALTVQQVLTDAAREGARHAVLVESTSSVVKERVGEHLRIGNIDPTAAEVTITPTSLSGTKSGTRITVEVKVAYRNVSWLAVPKYLGQATLGSTCSMRHE
jgi:Flp pilus assembly protein TadG